MKRLFHNKICLVAIAFALNLLIGTAPVFAVAGQKIGIVDMQRAVSETREGGDARAVIFKRTEKLNNELKGIQSDFEKLKTELEKEGAAMKAETRADKERLLQQKSRDFQKRQRDAQEELKQLDADLLQSMINRFSLLLGKIGEENAYDLILDQSAGVRFFNKKIDVTPLLIKKADETFAK
jgi:outer membrane protein